MRINTCPPSPAAWSSTSFFAGLMKLEFPGLPVYPGNTAIGEEVDIDMIDHRYLPYYRTDCDDRFGLPVYDGGRGMTVPAEGIENIGSDSGPLSMVKGKDHPCDTSPLEWMAFLNDDACIGINPRKKRDGSRAHQYCSLSNTFRNSAAGEYQNHT